MPGSRKRWLSAALVAMVGAAVCPLTASAGGHHGKTPPPLKCVDLAGAILDDHGNDDLFLAVFPGKGHDAFPGKGRDSGPRSRVLAATSVSVPAGAEPPPFPGGPPGAPFPAHCEVNLKLFPAINIRVGLPLSNADGGNDGGVDGAWNGKLQNLGGGGFAGSVGNVRGPVTAGYVGSSTDTGHDETWCAANSNHVGLNTPGSNPFTSQCGLGGGAFVLDQSTPPRLIKSQVKDFITDSILAQTLWAMKLSKLYYAAPIKRNYWNGCSTGGRQGFEMAQQYGTCSTASWSVRRP